MTDLIARSLQQPEADSVFDLLSALRWSDETAHAVQTRAIGYIEAIRKTRRKPASLESFFNQYGLDTQEGLALMSLAEALLRIPDRRTASTLIRDKISGTDWLKSKGEDKDWLMQAAGLGLKLTSGTMNSLLSKLGEPIIHDAMAKAMRLLGKQFVIGETLPKAMSAAQKWEDKNFRFSYDVLGEGAHTARDAEHYFTGYMTALQQIADQAASIPATAPRPGLSVKLSALYPRYETLRADECVPHLTLRLMELANLSARHNIGLTVDAEEVARLPLSLKIFENVLNELYGEWDGFGLAVQAYHKGAPAVIDHIIALSKTAKRKLQMRLVKGAYWDTEIKHAQVHGFDSYPVYTRKHHTDLSYLRCAQKMLGNRDALYPMFGTHNASTVAGILELAGSKPDGFEFQKLYGMGDALYHHLTTTDAEIRVCVYAPVGPFHDLLPYLVRRMLENGANSNFVHQIYNKAYAPIEIAEDPVKKTIAEDEKHHPKIPLPPQLFSSQRKNSKGLNSDDPVQLALIQRQINDFAARHYTAMPLIAGKRPFAGVDSDKLNPANTLDSVGEVYVAHEKHIDMAFDAAEKGFHIWSQRPAHDRAKTLEKLAELIETNRMELITLIMREAGRTFKDAIDEVREAVDFCYYYASEGQKIFSENGQLLTSATGERNIYSRKGRGIFVCISPWNFPVAIYLGQIAAALMAGNAVIAKPAEQTPLTAFFLAELILKSGLPPEAFTLLPGDGRIGAMLTAHPKTDGVVFTGSTETAQIIHQSLAAKSGGIARLIAETGGQNAMIVDSSALTEQVVDDVILSAFGSAGQRCSACRILYIQDDVADKTILMLQGAMQELKIGAPLAVETDIGPLIDEDALRKAQAHKTGLEGFSRKIAEAPMDPALKQQGHFFAPLAVELDTLDALKGEVFAPILHVIRFGGHEIDRVIDEINAQGYALTFGIHSRIDRFITHVTSRIHAGNIYINRSMIGAVVGVQPFGGYRMSGTGPKAGGPDYLRAFCHERVICTNTTAAGGNASLVMLGK